MEAVSKLVWTSPKATCVPAELDTLWPQMGEIVMVNIASFVCMRTT